MFSIGGRVLTSHRSSLAPELIEALLCLGDWLPDLSLSDSGSCITRLKAIVDQDIELSTDERNALEIGIQMEQDLKRFVQGISSGLRRNAFTDAVGSGDGGMHLQLLPATHGDGVPLSFILQERGFFFAGTSERGFYFARTSEEHRHIDMGKAEDRISNLPDSLLHHILSFVETKIVARTSVLSHRWKYIWICIPNLEIECDVKNTDRFMNFVDGTLNRHSLSNCIQKLCLKSCFHLPESHVISCISNVVKKNNLKELSLFLFQKKPLCIPQSVFNCASLVSLELRIYPHIHFPDDITFPRLKRLRLRDLKLNNDCWNDKLFINSPILEELYLDSCAFLVPSFCIAISTLKILKINDANGMQHCALNIHAPSLLSLFYNGPVAKEYVLSSFVSLMEAVVQVPGTLGESSTNEALSQIFRALAHVKCLTVNVPPSEEDNLLTNLPTYHNLKHLKVTGVPHDSDVRVIALLKVTPSLESLVIEKKAYFRLTTVDNQGNEDDGWTSLDRGCLFQHLKTFCFIPLSWGPREISCVKVILRNAKALQSFTIYSHSSGWPLTEIEQQRPMVRIKSFQRASESCSFKFCS
ncbi:F-box/LRR-repeat protein At4g14103-like [Papaver somniferum]|uniref:F-box/LRR-repeat protein At4g14103-like n=1 Tax=Papaver somniferum TaxID=3469 RepID=UPI000E6FA7E1|nr:F-box/LRR-repeat protein At4g14103-like [Papaver somniferum]